MGGSGKDGEESVDELLQKLARKGKKVKVLEDGGDDEHEGRNIRESIEEQDDEDDENAQQRTKNIVN